MSTHVVPEGERLRHELTLDCPCRPHQQLGVDVDGGQEAVAWGIVHHPLTAPADDRTADPAHA